MRSHAARDSHPPDWRMTCLESLLNVSIVEDDEAVRKSLRNLLRSAGHRVELFASAEEFFAAAASASSHVVITDIQRSEEHTSELQSLRHLVCRLLLEKKKTHIITVTDTI